MWHWAWLDFALQSQTGPHVERNPRQRLPSCKFPAEEFSRTLLLLLFGNQHLFREPLNNDFSHILMRLKRHCLNVTFIEAPSIGAKFSSLTKPFTPRWDSPRNLNKDFLLSSQKPWKRKKTLRAGIISNIKPSRLKLFSIRVKVKNSTWSSAAGGNLQQESSRVTSMQPCQM